MLFRTFLLSALPLFSLVPSTAALLGINLDLLGLTKLDLDVGLLKNGGKLHFELRALPSYFELTSPLYHFQQHLSM